MSSSFVGKDMSELENNSAILVFRGMHILGTCLDAVNENTALLSSFVLMDKYDKELKYFLYWRETKKYPQTEEEVNTSATLEALERIKGFIRHGIQEAIQHEIRLTEYGKKHVFNQMLAEMKDSSKPHPLGSVAQLAERFNISKSEVRRMRTAGTLSNFISEKTGTENQTGIDHDQAGNTETQHP